MASAAAPELKDRTVATIACEHDLPPGLAPCGPEDPPRLDHVTSGARFVPLAGLFWNQPIKPYLSLEMMVLLFQAYELLESLNAPKEN